MSENLFENQIREKLHNLSFPGETGDWEGLAARMTARTMLLRRRRFVVVGSAAAAGLLLLLFLISPGINRAPAPLETLRVIREPMAGIDIPASRREITPLYARAQLDKLRSASRIPSTSELYVVPSGAAAPEQVAGEPADVAREETPVHRDMAVQDALPENNKAQNGLFPVDPPKRIRLNKKWITAANFSYQGAINGTYLFTPSTYTTKWETPLSLAGSDLSNLGIPDYMTPHFDDDDMNRISAHFSTPISAGINVQKEFNKWLSVGASLTYTLLRGEYQVHTADKSYVVNQNTHYIGIPVSIYFNAVNTPHLTVYAVGGGAVDRAVADEYICQLNDVATRQYVPVQGLQWSVYGGLGIEYKWSELMGIYLEPTVSHYFDNNQPKSIRTIQPTQFKVELGIRFRI